LQDAFIERFCAFHVLHINFKPDNRVGFHGVAP
jgi:hypothetical protein